MQFGFSAKKNAFYLLSEEKAYRQGGSWQEDIIPVTDEVWREFINQPPPGKTRGSDKDGLPEWVDYTETQHIADERARIKRELMLERADAEIRMLNIVNDVYGLSDIEKKKLNEWKKHLAEVYRCQATREGLFELPNPPESE